MVAVVESNADQLRRTRKRSKYLDIDQRNQRIGGRFMRQNRNPLHRRFSLIDQFLQRSKTGRFEPENIVTNKYTRFGHAVMSKGNQLHGENPL